MAHNICMDCPWKYQHSVHNCCKMTEKNKKLASKVKVANNKYLNDTAVEMKNVVDEIAIANLALSPKEMLKIVRINLNEKRNGNWFGMLELQVKSRMCCVQNKIIRKDVCCIIENTNVSKMKDMSYFDL